MNKSNAGVIYNTTLPIGDVHLQRSGTDVCLSVRPTMAHKMFAACREQ